MLGDPQGGYSGAGHRSDVHCRSEIARRSCCWVGPSRGTRNTEAPTHLPRSVSSPAAVRVVAETGSSCRAPGSTLVDILQTTQFK